MKGFKESVYIESVASYFNGVKEYHTPFGQYIDVLSKEYCIEVDRAHKYAESIGQSLYYAKQMNKKPCIVFIYDYPNDYLLLNRLTPLLKSLCIRVYTIDILTREIKLRF